MPALLNRFGRLLTTGNALGSPIDGYPEFAGQIDHVPVLRAAVSVVAPNGVGQPMRYVKFLVVELLRY